MVYMLSLKISYLFSIFYTIRELILVDFYFAKHLYLSQESVSNCGFTDEVISHQRSNPICSMSSTTTHNSECRLLGLL